MRREKLGWVEKYLDRVTMYTFKNKEISCRNLSNWTNADSELFYVTLLPTLDQREAKNIFPFNPLPALLNTRTPVRR